MTRLYDFLSRHRRIGLDTNFFIYEFAANPRYTPVADPLFRQIGAGDHTIVTSTITLTELLVQPYRDNDGLQIRIIYSRIASNSAIDWVQPSAIIADTAARIRATHNLKTIDAIQAATAIHAGATGLITNDPVFHRIPYVETLVLDQLL